MNTTAKLFAAMPGEPARLADRTTANGRASGQYGIVWRHQGTSHCYFMRTDGAVLSVPAHRPIKPAYARLFVDLVKGA